MAAAETVAMRKPTEAASLVGEGTPRDRQRAASNAYLTASGYGMRACQECGAVAKVPPTLKERVTRCPRCLGELGPWRE